MYATLGLRMLRQTPRLMRSSPIEDQAVHGITGRLARLKSVPTELYPLAVVVAFAVSAGCYSLSRHLLTDKTIRLARQGGSSKQDPPAHH